MVEFQAMPCTF